MIIENGVRFPLFFFFKGQPMYWIFQDLSLNQHPIFYTHNSFTVTNIHANGQLAHLVFKAKFGQQIKFLSMCYVM